MHDRRDNLGHQAELLPVQRPVLAVVFVAFTNRQQVSEMHPQVWDAGKLGGLERLAILEKRTLRAHQMLQILERIPDLLRLQKLSGLPQAMDRGRVHGSNNRHGRVVIAHLTKDLKIVWQVALEKKYFITLRCSVLICVDFSYLGDRDELLHHLGPVFGLGRQQDHGANPR